MSLLGGIALYGGILLAVIGIFSLFVRRYLRGLGCLVFAAAALACFHYFGHETSTTNSGTSDAREIDRDLNCSALLMVLSKGLESSGYPNKTEIADMQRMTVAYQKKAEALAGASLQDKLVDAAMTEQEREKTMIQSDGFDAMLADLQKRKNACGYHAAP